MHKGPVATKVIANSPSTVSTTTISSTPIIVVAILVSNLLASATLIPFEDNDGNTLVEFEVTGQENIVFDTPFLADNGFVVGTASGANTRIAVWYTNDLGSV